MPLQKLYSLPELEQRLSEAARRAFGQGVVLNRFGGSQLTLHVGAPPGPFSTAGPPPVEYLQGMGRLPSMQDQGDGVKSFIGILISVMAAPFFFLLIDEPDAFLHPPQALLMGAMLAELKPADAQLFVATHDANLLRGMLDATNVPLTVIRLDRHGERTSCAQLGADDIRRLWSDPLLRYSNLLDGLFHSAVVVCESDSDCRFYGSVLDVLSRESNSPADVLLTHCGGKQRMKTAVQSMRAVSVPVAAVVDSTSCRVMTT